MRARVPVCDHAAKDLLSDTLLGYLCELERTLSFKLHFVSGFRCDACNEAAGGVPNSGHLRGLAVDCLIPDSATRFKVIHCALRIGFRRIGIGKNFIHLDIDDRLPQNMIWTYN